MLLGTLIDLVSEGEKLALLMRASKDRGWAKAQHVAWRASVKEHLKDDPLALARFRNARPVLDVRVGMASEIAGYWQSLQGELAVLIAIAGEREQAQWWAWWRKH